MSETGYLCVDRYTSTLTGTSALATAFEVGLVDLMLEHRTSGPLRLASALDIDEKGMDILLGLLQGTGVVEKRGDEFALSGGFLEALEYRDLLEVRAFFSNLCAIDLIKHFTTLVQDPQRFLGSADLFKLFDYGHAMTHGQDNLERTRHWVRITTTLTKYEAAAVMEHHDFSRYRRILDIGGNSGEFVLRICKAYNSISGTVFDLPLVSEVGRQHVSGEPEKGRIDFLGGDALKDNLPDGYDIVTFKSVLHDWPDDAARKFLHRASRSVVPGGTLLIFERGPMDMTAAEIPYHQVPYLLFARFFRDPDLYINEMEKLGYRDVKVKWIELDMPFFMIVGVKPAEPNV